MLKVPEERTFCLKASFTKAFIATSEIHQNSKLLKKNQNFLIKLKKEVLRNAFLKIIVAKEDKCQIEHRDLVFRYP